VSEVDGKRVDDAADAADRVQGLASAEAVLLRVAHGTGLAPEVVRERNLMREGELERQQNVVLLGC
jgi:CO/xanthine dehydrogenase Mo-binding subunit